MITSNLELSWSSRWGARKQVAREATPPVRQLVPSCWSRPITPDMVTQTIFAVPMILLYLLGILIAAVNFFACSFIRIPVSAPAANL